MRPGPRRGGARAWGRAPPLPGTAPVDAFRPPPASTGASHHRPVDARRGPRSADRASGILAYNDLDPPEARSVRRRCDGQVTLVSTTQEGAIGFDFGS